MIITLKDLLDETDDTITIVLKNKAKYYTSFPIRKRSGKLRWINAPQSHIKKWQRIIVDKLLYNYSAHPIAHGFVRKKSPITNARHHTQRKILVTLDIKDFFNSITDVQVANTLQYLMSLPKAPIQLSIPDIMLVVEILTYNGVLPQGSPASPIMSNLVCIGADSKIAALQKLYNCVITRYADDIAVSSDTNMGLPAIIKEIRKILYLTLKVKVNQAKIHVSRQSRRMTVTGIVVNKKINIAKIEAKKIRAKIYNLLKTKTNISTEELQKLRGKVEWIKNLNPQKGKALLVQLLQIPVLKA